MRPLAQALTSFFLGQEMFRRNKNPGPYYIKAFHTARKVTPLCQESRLDYPRLDCSSVSRMVLYENLKFYVKKRLLPNGDTGLSKHKSTLNILK